MRDELLDGYNKPFDTEVGRPELRLEPLTGDGYVNTLTLPVTNLATFYRVGQPQEDSFARVKEFTGKSSAKLAA